MKYKKINKNFPNVSAIGIGHMGADDFRKKNISDGDAIKLLRYSLDCGMNLIDTAENYGNGKSEEIIGKTILPSERENIYISTKVSPENLNYDNVIKSCKNSLKRLQTDYIDIYHIHWPNTDIELEETLNAMNQLQDSGFIRHIALSNFPYYMYEDAKKYAKIDVMQFEYNAIEQMDIIHLYTRDNILSLGYSPLHIPENAIKYGILRILSKKYDVGINKLLINWISNSNENLIPLVKSNTEIHIRDNSTSLNFELEQTDVDILNFCLHTDWQFIPMKQIKVKKTLLQAIENKQNFCPSPVSIANWMSRNNGILIKPIKVRKLTEEENEYKYELCEGQARFWANMICYNGNTNALISTIII